LLCSTSLAGTRDLDTNWVLKLEVIHAIEDAFDGPASIYRNLGTSNKYWEPKFKERSGVKKKTVENLALRFVRRLLEVHERTFTGSGLDTRKAMKYFKKFEESALSDDVSSMIEQLRDVAEQTSIPDDQSQANIPRIGNAAG
jgi:hypothetical protein